MRSHHHRHVVRDSIAWYACGMMLVPLLPVALWLISHGLYGLTGLLDAVTGG